MVAILLSALVAYRRQRSAGRVCFAENTARLADCVELVAARSFMALESLGGLPTVDGLEPAIQSLGRRSPWLFSLGGVIVATFQDIVYRSHLIREVEKSGPPDGAPPPSHSLELGDWVYTHHSGVTEVLGIESKIITVAIVDGPGAELIRMNVSRTDVRLTGMRRTC